MSRSRVGVVALMTIELKKLCINKFNLEGTILYWPPTSRFLFEEKICVNKFVSTNLCTDRTFGKTPALSEFEIIQGTFLLKFTFLLIFQIFRQKIALPRAITNWKF